MALPPSADGEAASLLSDLLLGRESSPGAPQEESQESAAADPPGNGEWREDL